MKRTEIAVRRWKKRTLRKRAKTRAAVRFGMQLNRHEIREIVGVIRANRAVFLERLSNRMSFWLLPVKESLVVVSYDDQRHMIGTITRPESKRSWAEVKNKYLEKFGCSVVPVTAAGTNWASP